MQHVSRAHNLARWAVRRPVQRWLMEHPTVGPLLKSLPEYWRFPLEVLDRLALVYNPFRNEYARVAYTPTANGVVVDSITTVDPLTDSLAEFPTRCFTCRRAVCGCPVYLGRGATTDARSFNLSVHDPMPDSPVLFHNAAEVEDEPIGD